MPLNFLKRVGEILVRDRANTMEVGPGLALDLNDEGLPLIHAQPAIELAAAASEPKVHRGTEPPEDTALLWLDLSTSPSTMRWHDGATWVPVGGSGGGTATTAEGLLLSDDTILSADAVASMAYADEAASGAVVAAGEYTDSKIGQTLTRKLIIQPTLIRPQSASQDFWLGSGEIYPASTAQTTTQGWIIAGLPQGATITQVRVQVYRVAAEADLDVRIEPYMLTSPDNGRSTIVSAATRKEYSTEFGAAASGWRTAIFSGIYPNKIEDSTFALLIRLTNNRASGKSVGDVRLSHVTILYTVPNLKTAI